MKAYIYHSAAHRPAGLRSSSPRDSVDYYVRTVRNDHAETQKTVCATRMARLKVLKLYKYLPLRAVDHSSHPPHPVFFQNERESL
jgi:hypothetical protein